MRSPIANEEIDACPHHCPKCGQGWRHDMIIAENVHSCRLKRVATCHPCLKEVARVFGSIHNRMDPPLEKTLWEPPGIQEAGHPASS